jgi:iron complex outermembrane recepter protein
MRRIILIAIALLSPLISIGLYTVETRITGVVTDGEGVPIEGAHVYIQELRLGVATNGKGEFTISNAAKGVYRVHVSYLGYRCIHNYTVDTRQGSIHSTYVMVPDALDIDAVSVATDRNERLKRENSLPMEMADALFIEQHMGSSLMKSLESIPGVVAMEVGQGFSKPAIRGLGFNRVVVVDNGLKHEGQQWGADHGLEVDQLSVERVEVIKGPASLQHGSDAIGGVVNILPPTIPAAHTVEGSVMAIGKSVNSLMGGSAMVKTRTHNFYTTTRYTHTSFGDYRVPADSIFYNRYRLPIHNQRLKNTAGLERNASITLGVVSPWGRSAITASTVFGRAGFFPGSHGIPQANSLTHDGSTRNIELPNQQVSHHRVSWSTVATTRSGRLGLDIGYQNNHRQEWSTFHTHYDNQEPPEENPDLELDFKLHTLSGTALYTHTLNRISLSAGVNSQYQNNAIGGYSFLLPSYTRLTLGTFALASHSISPSLVANAGIRFDYGTISINEFISPYTNQAKAPNFKGIYHDVTWGAGLSYTPIQALNIKINGGKSFRMPSANELGANGIHHGSFRYEVGDWRITSEYSYQLDFGAYLSLSRFGVGISPFVGYFPNFIFLSPTGSYLHPNGEEIVEADAGQVYQFRQSEALRVGGEIDAWVSLTKNLKLLANGEAVFATDYTFPLPYTPPPLATIAVQYTLPYYWKGLHKLNFRAHGRMAAAQQRNSRNELSTPGYSIYGVSLSGMIVLLPLPVNVTLQVQNILDRVYWNHVSFYRYIEIPEAGRNIQVTLSVPFEKKSRGSN